MKKTLPKSSAPETVSNTIRALRSSLLGYVGLPCDTHLLRRVLGLVIYQAKEIALPPQTWYINSFSVGKAGQAYLPTFFVVILISGLRRWLHSRDPLQYHYKNGFESARDLNPGPQSEKRKCDLCAMQPPYFPTYLVHKLLLGRFKLSIPMRQIIPVNNKQ